MIKCAGLVHLDSTKNKILLVRVRDNELFYLAGGKIEDDETPEQTLIRELAEELNVEVISESIKHVVTITAPAYPQNDIVQLFCYTAKWIGEINIQAEISALEYIPLTDIKKMAPGVQKLVNHLISQEI
ncbi:MAG: hypothetical protein K0R14_1862 [Burkholderiales bacterium]|jgi:8-oxo-dGTP pyrophosphatase MutT (NUDIX family)|nr:hypothetical protein [Burkholderiales bacterium]